MSENDIKPVLWDVTEYICLDGSRVEDITPCPDGRFVRVDDYQSAIDLLTAERDDLNTLLMALQARHREVMAERDSAVADRDALSTMLAVAGGRLEEAANEIEDWGAYADEFFQKKHLLAEVVQSFRDDAKDAADAARSEGE